MKELNIEERRKQMNVLGYVIQCENDNGEHNYYAIDDLSGGYPYWSPFITSAKIFKTQKEAEKIVNDPKLEKKSEFIDGSKHPHRMIHSGIELSNNKIKGFCTLSVKPIMLGNETMHKKFEGKLEEIKGYIY